MSRFAGALGFGLLLACVSTSATAQGARPDSGRTGAARTLFEEGVAFVDQERWADAEERFRRALELRPSPVITFNLASALAKQDKVIEASELLQGLLKNMAADATTREPAAELLAEVERRIARLTIEVRGELATHTVSLDGRDLHAAEVGVALPLDPGAHLVLARRGDLSVFSREITLAPGRAEHLTLDLPGAKGSSVATRAPRANLADPPAVEEGPPAWLLWTGAGVAVAAAVVVAVLVVSSASSN